MQLGQALGPGRYCLTFSSFFALLILAPIVCEAGWYGFNNSCYLFQKEGKPWSDARTDCQKRGGDLVIVDSREEHNFLSDRIKRSNTVRHQF